MITISYTPLCKFSEVEIFKFATYKDFYDFWVKNNTKGIIYAVQNDGRTT